MNPTELTIDYYVLTQCPVLMLSYRGLSCIYKRKQSSEEDVQFWKTTCLEKQTIIKGETSSQLEDTSWDPSLLILPPDVYIYSRLGEKEACNINVSHLRCNIERCLSIYELS